ncbi:MAG: 50S ribosomal protein L1 [Nanoarchaeota archaeon]|nr:50S ribosomal protein L1 [Nanoarchaeota archaeon]
MDKKKVLDAVKLAREFSKQRNFSQTFDIIINLKDLNPKKADENIDLFTTLPNSKGKQVKICAFVDKDLTEKAKVFDQVISESEFIKYQKPKEIKQLAEQYDFFIAQANIMTSIAKTFGKVLGARGKMPNPKAGCIITPASDLEQLKLRIQKTVRLKTKNEPIIKVPVGKEDMQDEQVAENIISLYNTLAHSLPKEEENIRDLFVKLTMSPAVRLGEKKAELEQRLKAREAEKSQPGKRKSQSDKQQLNKQPAIEKKAVVEKSGVNQEHEGSAKKQSAKKQKQSNKEKQEPEVKTK